MGALDDDGRRAVAAATDEDPPGAAADLAVLDHLAALLGIEDELDPLEAIGALDLDLIDHGTRPRYHVRSRAAAPARWPR